MAAKVSNFAAETTWRSHAVCRSAKSKIQLLAYESGGLVDLYWCFESTIVNSPVAHGLLTI